jgi:hypothetical protein
MKRGRKGNGNGMEWMDGEGEGARVADTKIFNS